MSSPSPAALPNYFTSAEVAARYTRVRPFFHNQVAERLRAFAGVQRFHRALDVGCGSGQSSIALAAIADRVIAIDASPGMLSHAAVRPNISYQLGFAEQLDFAAGEFDLVSVGSALHWFDQDRFFAQCQKVMAPTALLAVYNDHLTAHMQPALASLAGSAAISKTTVAGSAALPAPAAGSAALPAPARPAACKHWMRTRFLKRFPAPQRGMRDINELKAAECGFEVAERSSFSHLVAFSRPEFIAYLLTCSNTLAAILSGKQTHPSVVDWLDAELAPILPGGTTGEFIFKCNLWMLRRSTAL
jgi:SAM-dependent methyltransferase